MAVPQFNVGQLPLALGGQLPGSCTWNILGHSGATGSVSVIVNGLPLPADPGPKVNKVGTPAVKVVGEIVVPLSTVTLNVPVPPVATTENLILLSEIFGVPLS